jgi:hypothetical protein
MYELQGFMFDCEVKFLLDTKLIVSKNYNNFEVFCFSCCGYEVVYYYLFENERCLCLKSELKSFFFLVVIMSKVSEIAAKTKESLLQSFLLILFLPNLNKIVIFSCFDVYFEVKPKIDKRPLYFIIIRLWTTNDIINH